MSTVGTWETASPGDILRRQIIKIACNKHPEIFDFLFRKDRPEMYAGANEMWSKSGVLSSGERAIVGFALSVWFDTNHANICEIVHQLDEDNFKNFSLALGIWRSFKARGIAVAYMDHTLALAIGCRPL